MTAKSVLEFLPSRRALLKMAISAAAAPLPLRLAYAETPNDRRLVLVILRGGLDGLATVAPLGDPDYRRARGTLAMSSGDAGHALGPDFALHPAFDDLGPFWQRNELAAVHALALPYRTRSHFDAQDLLETGLTRPASASEGWLNRTIAVLGGDRSVAPTFEIGESIIVLVLGAKGCSCQSAPCAS